MTTRQSRSSLRPDKMTEQGRSRSLSSRITPVRTRLQVPGSVIRSRSTDIARHKKKDARPVNDKIWQQNKLSYVQEYFINYECVSDILNNGKSIRPLTLTMFVTLMSVLLKRVWNSSIEITIHNYCEVIPNILNNMKYPGKISNSILKTANTPYAWPHILAIFSWLIELIQTDVSFSLEQITKIDPEDSEDTKVFKLRNKACFHAFDLWNKSQKYDSSLEMYLADYKKLKNIEEEKLISHNNEFYRLNENAHKIEEKLIVAKGEVKDLNTELLDLRKDYENVKVTRLKQQQFKVEMTAKINRKKAEISEIKNGIEKMECSNRMLKEKISKQSMSLSEKKCLLKDINDLKEKVNLRKKTIDQEQKISDDIDLSLTHLKKKLQEMSNTRNNSLIELSLRIPQLREIFMPEDGFLNSDMPKILNEKIKRKQELLSQLEEKERSKKRNVKHLKSLLDAKNNEIDVVNDQLRKELAIQASKTAEIEMFKKEMKEAEKVLLQEIQEKTELKRTMANETLLIKQKQRQLYRAVEKLENSKTQEAERRKKKENFFQQLHKFNLTEVKRISAIMKEIDTAENKCLSDLQDCCLKEK